MKSAKNVKKVEKSPWNTNSYSEKRDFKTASALVAEWSEIAPLSITATSSHTGIAASMSCVEKMIVLP